ncbi:MAG: hypothetical protein CMM01_02575 [Rhodopirellula sp.]|nr:hypothetical protein [Rhodopirellula sp.]
MQYYKDGSDKQEFGAGVRIGLTKKLLFCRDQDPNTRACKNCKVSWTTGKLQFWSSTVVI